MTMKKNIFLLLTIISLLLTSCSNLFEKSEQKFATISGNIIFENLLPERTIIPDSPAISSTDIQITVELLYAENDGLGAEPLTLTAGATSYTITLPYWTSTPSSYKVRATAKKGSVEILSGISESFSIYYENQVVLKDIILYPVQTSGKGGINLNITVDSDTGITNASVSVPGKLSAEGTKSDTTFTFQSSSDSTTANTYEATFAFKNDEGEILYSFTQLIYICSGVQSNTWVKNGDEPYLITTTSGGVTTTSCHITKALVDAFRLTQIYVDTSATSTTQSGTFQNPCKTFNTVLTKLKDASKDYTILIKGTIDGQTHGVLSITDELSSTAGDTKAYHAHSLTICGATGVSESGIPQDVINAKSFDIALSITTQVPVTIKNLKIMRGYSEDSGGGIYSTGDLTLDSGTLITQNTAKYYGGGVANDGGKLTIKSGAIISSNEVLYAKKGTDDCGGGGVYNRNGTLIMSGGTIKSNTAEGCGGGIFCTGTDANVFLYGTAVIGNGEATEIAQAANNKHSNSAKNGGGIYLDAGTHLYLGYMPVIGGDPVETGYTGGIYYNYASNSSTNVNDMQGGGGIYTSGTDSEQVEIEMHSGEIAYNYTPSCGGGIIMNKAKFTFTGGTIKTNSADVMGKAILRTAGIIQFGGTATSTEDNDIFCMQGARINLLSPLHPENGVTAVITPNVYRNNQTGITIRIPAESTTSLPVEYKKFLITPQVESGVTTCWGIDKSNGYLKKLIGKKNRPDAKYDIVFNDGSATAFSEGLSLSDDEKAAAIAVIFYVGTECSNDNNTTYRKLGVGLKQGTDKYWCLGEENMVGCPSIRCQPGGSAGNWGWAADADKNGSDNLQQFAENLLTKGKSDTTSNPSAYPAFYFSINYASVSGSNVSGSDYETGWYLPSACELSRIYLENKETATTVNTLNTIMDKCAGTTFYTSGAHIYGTSSTDNDDYYCGYVGFNTNNYTFKDDEDWDYFQRNYVKCIALAIHEF